MVDLDPRWVIKLIKMGELDMAERYKQHVVEQGLTLLRAHENIQCLFTTPKLLEAICEKVSLKRMGIKGVFCGGTEMTPQFYRFAVEELLDGVYFAPTYGNTLMGLAVHKPRVPEDNFAIIYYPPSPRAMIEVVDPDHPERVVGHGETGRVRLTTLTKELGYLLGPEARGRGVATRALALLVAYAFAELGMARIQALVHPDNPASGRVLERLGFRREGLLRAYRAGEHGREDRVMYSLLADELEAPG